MGGFGSFVRSAATVLPEVPKPARKPSLNEKLVWTGIALGVYMTLSQIPLYGVTAQANQFLFAQIVFASSQGTLMTLGIGPIVTAGLILQLLKGSEIIRLDFKKPEDRSLFTSATKLLTFFVIVMEGGAFLIGGAFGAVSSGAAAIILIELFAASVVVMMLDELVQKGWGVGSGISLFILAGVAQRITWDLFAPIGAGNDRFLGILPFALERGLAGDFGAAIFRPGISPLPSIFGLVMTIITILIIIYIEGMRIEIPITSTKYRGFAGVYPIKLLYTSNVPVILVSALAANIAFFSQFLWARFNPLNQDPWFNWLATYNATSPQGGATGGLVYYITTPGSLSFAAADPFRAVTFVGFMVLFSTLFAKIWVEIGGLAPKAAAKSLIDAKVQVPGFRRVEGSIEMVLGRYIPAITAVSGIAIGLLASVADLLGTFGTGIGLLLMTSITLQYYQMLMREQLETMMPRLAGLLGR